MTPIALNPPRNSVHFPVRLPAMFGILARALTWLRDDGADRSALLKMSDRDLRDIGLTRDDVVDHFHRQDVGEAGAVIVKRTGNW